MLGFALMSIGLELQIRFLGSGPPCIYRNFHADNKYTKCERVRQATIDCRKHGLEEYGAVVRDLEPGMDIPCNSKMTIRPQSFTFASDRVRRMPLELT